MEDIKVESFALSTTTNYANLEGSIEYDDNGEKCALIIVDTKYPERLTFNGGSLGIKKVLCKTGQVWVYVPDGLKRITISGEGVGTLRDYDLGLSVKKARTYILRLTTKDIETIVFNDAIQSNMRISVVSAKDGKPIHDAEISINGIKEELDNKGVLEKKLSGATYRYRVDAELYKTESGTFIVDGSSNEFVIKLTPNFEIVTINALKNSEIWIGAQLKGKHSWSGPLIYGEHTVTCKMEKHYDSKETIHVVENQSNIYTVTAPIPITGELSITSTPIGAELFIDGIYKGKTPLKIPIIIGHHKIEIKNTGYALFEESVDVQENKRHRIDAQMKLTRNVNIVTYPTNAHITIDNQEYGFAPKRVELQPGTHRFIINSKGYYPVKKNIYLKDNQNSIRFDLKRLNFKSSEIYFSAGYRPIGMKGIQGCIGGYLHNLNVELGYVIGTGKSSPIYWYTTDADIPPTSSTYQSSAYLLRVGYGLVLNNTIRFTPQLGLTHISLKETSDSEDTYANGAYHSTLVLGCKTDIALNGWLSVTLTPEYTLSVQKSEGYELLENLSDDIKNLSNGLGFYAGINVRF